MTEMLIHSPAFGSGDSIPMRFTCDGENVSPALDWSGQPPGTKSLALIADDPDAPVGLFVHWVIYNLLPELTGLPEAVAKTDRAAGGVQGINDFRRTGYDGPCPPPGKPHRYYFTIYALDIPPALTGGLNAASLRKQAQGHILAQAVWMGRYQR